MHPHDKRLQFIELRSKGWSIYRISETIDVPKSTLCDWQKQDKARINELREMEQEALEEQLTEQREQEYQKLSSRLDRVERALDQQLQEKIATLSLMELCRLSSALRSQLGKLNGPSVRPAPRKMVRFGTTSPENGTAPQPCEAAECLSTLSSQLSPKLETGHFRAEPDIPDVRKDSGSPQSAETDQQEVSTAPKKATEVANTNVSHSETQPDHPAASPITAPAAPAPALPPATVIPERMIGGIIDPKRIIGRRCTQVSTSALSVPLR